MKHWPLFVEFCKQELATGGPDPQIATLQQLSLGKSLIDRVWLIGCYAAHHCVPSAYLVWSHWTVKDALTEQKAFQRWLKKYWTALPVRPEMRSHRMLAKRVECLTDFAQLALTYIPFQWETYDQAWTESQASVKYYGRYMAIKVIEMLRRFGSSPHLVLPDMRAKGGWSPRRCLGLLWPDRAETLLDRHDESPRALRVVENTFGLTRTRLREDHKVKVTNFQLQVMLCEYRETLHGGYYPGASLDEELTYIAQSRTMFSKAQLKPVIRARIATFRKKDLGEIRGWDGPRPDKFVPFKVPHVSR